MASYVSCDGMRFCAIGLEQIDECQPADAPAQLRWVGSESRRLRSDFAVPRCSVRGKGFPIARAGVYNISDCIRLQGWVISEMRVCTDTLAVESMMRTSAKHCFKLKKE